MPVLLLLSHSSHVRGLQGAHQAPLSLGFSRQEHWSEVPLPSPKCLYPLKINTVKLYPPMWWCLETGSLGGNSLIRVGSWSCGISALIRRDTKERLFSVSPREDTRRQSPTSQKSSHRNSTIPVLWCQTSSLQKCEKIHFGLWYHYGILRRLKQNLYEIF